MEATQVALRPRTTLGRFPARRSRTFLRSVGPSDRSCNQTGHVSFRPDRRNRMFVLGMGFVGQFFGQHLKNRGWVVSGTCTSEGKKKELQGRGLEAFLFDANSPELSILEMAKSYTHLLVSIPTVQGIGDPLLQHRDLVTSTLSGGNLEWLCYLSSTSVYGDSGGAWVDEDYLVRPTSEAAKSRIAAEEGWLSIGDFLGLSTQVFRLGGIYGPARSAVDALIKKEPLSKGQKMRASRKYTSRVHVHDICQAVEASISRPSSRRIYNVVDDDPAPREEVFAYAQHLIDMKWPGLAKHDKSPEIVPPHPEGTGSRGEKRVLNTRMKKELGVRLLYPSYKSGLASAIRDDTLIRARRPLHFYAIISAKSTGHSVRRILNLACYRPSAIPLKGSRRGLSRTPLEPIADKAPRRRLPRVPLKPIINRPDGNISNSRRNTRSRSHGHSNQTRSLPQVPNTNQELAALEITNPYYHQYSKRRDFQWRFGLTI